MNNLLKNLGLIMVIIGAIVLVVCYWTGYVNENLPLLISAALIILGIITYIVVNKRITE